VVTNDMMAEMVPTSDEWIRERSGIQQRHFIDSEVGVSDLSFEAAKSALEKAGLQPQDIDMIVFATLSPDYMFPGSGVLLQEKLGIPGVPALDVRNQCSGFVYSLSVADQFIRTGMYDRVMVVGAEVHSTGLEYNERGRHVTVLFGDGAGVVILEASENGRGILSTHLHADGRHALELCVTDPGSRRIPRLSPELLENGSCYPQMNGREVFKYAVTKFPEVIKEALQQNQLTTEDIKLLIPHQANLRISEAVAHRLKLRPDQVYNNIQRYGNTTAASIPIALDEALEKGLVEENDIVVLAAFGSGFTWASAAIRW
ncbi:MAG: beta-ketoacyl-ACP synthase III, partial [bacterium]